MNIEGEPCYFSYWPDRIRSHGDVRSKVAVSHVHMDHVSPCFLNPPNLTFQVSVVGGEYRRSDFYSGHSFRIDSTSFRTVSLSGAFPWYAGSHSMKGTP